MGKLNLEKNRMSMPPGFNDEDYGFSLVELMIAMAVGLVVLGAAYSVFTAQNKTLTAQEQIVELQQNVRSAMDMITRDARMAGYNPNPKSAIRPTGLEFTGLTVGTSQIGIIANREGDDILSGDDSIIYAYDSADKKITRKAGNSNPQPLAENIEEFTVTQINPSQIRITIGGRTAAPDPLYKSNGGYRTYTLTSNIAVRNPIPTP